MDTTSRWPAPTCLVIGVILPDSGEPPRRPSTPSMRGTEKPQMSASMTPTAKPRSASAAARFTVTDDLPTPPLPEATMSTRQVAGTIVSGASWATFQRALAMAAAFSSGVSSDQVMCTLVTPGRPPMRARTSRWIWARSGQPEVVRAIVTSTRPSASIVAPLAMPSSTMSEPSSGSTTPRSSPITSSTVGGSPEGGPGVVEGPSDMPRAYGRCVRLL